MFTHRPAMKFCVPLIAGILLGWLYPLSVTLLLPVFLILVGLVFYAAVAPLKNSTIMRDIPLFTGILLLGVLKITADQTASPEEYIDRLIRSNTTVRVTGHVTDLPVLAARSIRFVIDAESLMVLERAYEISTGVSVTFPRSRLAEKFLDSLTYGRRVSLSGELQSLSSVRNPGDPDLQTYYHLNGIYARLNPQAIDSSSFGRLNDDNLLGRYVIPARKEIAHRIDSFIRGDEAKFLKGLVIGERSEVPQEMKTAFINSGVMHILAVSGLHVAIVVLMLLTIFRLFRLPEPVCIVLTILALVYYNFLTGSAASVSRSVIMAGIVLGAKVLQLRSDMYNSLAVSAIVILLVDTKQLLQPGFQLSYAAVFSLVYLYPKVFNLRRVLPLAIRDRKFVSASMAMLSISLAAGIGTLPFTAFYFGKISVVGVLTNLVAVPLSNVILALGMLMVAVSFVSVWCASIYGALTWILTMLLLKIVTWFGNVPHAYLDAQFNLLSAMIFYGILAVLIHWDSRSYRRYALICGLTVVTCSLFLGFLHPAPSATLKVTVLDVGQGDAIVVEFPDNKILLIDGGPITPTRDAGEMVILPYLRRRQIDHLQGILISHPHSDHLGGILSVLKTLPVDCVWDGGSDTASSLHRDYLRMIDSLHITRTVVQAGESIGGFEGARLYVLHPTGRFVSAVGRRRMNLNNQSVVVKLCYGRTSLLLEGDAEGDAERAISAAYGSFLRSDILKAAHHGSSTSSSPELLELAKPGRVAISVGIHNKFHHPSPEVLHRYTTLGLRYDRTDQEGAVVFASDGKHWQKIEWREP